MSNRLSIIHIHMLRCTVGSVVCPQGCAWTSEAKLIIFFRRKKFELYELSSVLPPSMSALWMCWSYDDLSKRHYWRFVSGIFYKSEWLRGEKLSKYFRASSGCLGVSRRRPYECNGPVSFKI
jgi:hypothetical protein